MGRNVIVARDFTAHARTSREEKNGASRAPREQEWGHGIFLFLPIRGRWRISLGGMAYFSSGISCWAPCPSRPIARLVNFAHMMRTGTRGPRMQMRSEFPSIPRTDDCRSPVALMPPNCGFTSIACSSGPVSSSLTSLTVAVRSFNSLTKLRHSFLYWPFGTKSGNDRRAR